MSSYWVHTWWRRQHTRNIPHTVCTQIHAPCETRMRACYVVLPNSFYIRVTWSNGQAVCFHAVNNISILDYLLAQVSIAASINSIYPHKGFFVFSKTRKNVLHYLLSWVRYCVYLNFYMCTSAIGSKEDYLLSFEGSHVTHIIFNFKLLSCKVLTLLLCSHSWASRISIAWACMYNGSVAYGSRDRRG
jgi:hypothetical protein